MNYYFNEIPFTPAESEGMETGTDFGTEPFELLRFGYDPILRRHTPYTDSDDDEFIDATAMLKDFTRQCMLQLVDQRGAWANAKKSLGLETSDGVPCDGKYAEWFEAVTLAWLAALAVRLSDGLGGLGSAAREDAYQIGMKSWKRQCEEFKKLTRKAFGDSVAVTRRELDDGMC